MPLWAYCLKFRLGCVCVNYAEKKFYETDTCSQFHKTCYAIINVAIGAFPQV